jgi:predicted DsbA family dithiol-disulfide isomerase
MIGLNLDQFKKDIEGEKATARVDSDQERANSLGVKMTPTVFINDREMDANAKTPQGLRAAIDAALKEKS